jgi:hypothetical protein
MLLQNTPQTVRMIAVAPVIPSYVIKENLHSNINHFLTYLQAIVDELDNSKLASFSVLSNLVK